MDSLSNEVLFHILSFCQPKDVLSFCGTSKENHSISKDNFFWCLYSKQRKHPKKLPGYTTRQWAIKQEKALVIVITSISCEQSFRGHLDCGGKTVRDLKKEIALRNSFAPQNITVRENKKVLKNDEFFSCRLFVTLSENSQYVNGSCHIFYDGQN
ncbi:F-box containing protein [Brazilian marseillevirus]|uniref:F-box containing protein n=1 Tax=Brazilian marseillevirus TaxID=1813599 RepID=UPI000783CA8D|nr:F-box containing protein [Brazilian marseillevirus]AMQ10534.1 F-box containing protein [Brazilian marseillevirus]